MSYSTYETEQPWVAYHYGATHDRWWPPWNSTRVLGHMKITCECAVCGERRTLSLRIPRFGTIPDRGRHPERVRFLLDHVHADRPHPMAWAKPLLNPAAHGPKGVDLDLLAMRLQAELEQRAGGTA